MKRKDSVVFLFSLSFIMFVLSVIYYNSVYEKNISSFSVELTPGAMKYIDFRFDVDSYNHDTIFIKILNEKMYPGFSFSLRAETYQIPSQYYNKTNDFEYYSEFIDEKGYVNNELYYKRYQPQSDHYTRLVLKNEYKDTTIYYTLEHTYMDIMTWNVRFLSSVIMILSLMCMIPSFLYLMFKSFKNVNNPGVMPNDSKA